MRQLLEAVAVGEEGGGEEMSNPKPVWPYFVIVIAGIALVIGAIWCLVMTVRANGLGQWYWSFNFVIIMIAVSALIANFVSKHD